MASSPRSSVPSMPPTPKKKPAPGQPAPQPLDDDPSDDDDDAPLTRADVAKMINGAVRAQLSRSLAPAIAEGLAPVLQQIASLKPATGDDEDDDVEQPTGGKRKPDVAVTKLTKQVENLTKQVKERDDRLAAETTARKAALLDNELGRELAAVGVDKLRLRGALAVHRAQAFVDDSGAVKYKIKRDGYDEDLDPSEALKEWAATDEGKSYLAPTGSTGGAGARAPRNAGAQRKPSPTSPEARADIKADAAAALPGLIDQMIGGGGSFSM